MEAATAKDAGLLSRDGALPIAPANTTPSRTGADPGRDEAIDGVTRCSCCDRFPLVGEEVIRHAAKGRKPTAWVCERCEAAGRAGSYGPATGRTRIRTVGGAMNVRRLR